MKTQRHKPMACAAIRSKFFAVIVVMLGSGMFSACIMENTDVAGGGIGGTGSTTGPINGFGSVFVNGLEIFTTEAGFTINGQPGSEEMLNVGMVVTVYGDLDNNSLVGTATQINFDYNVIGTVEAINRQLKVIQVAGQVVKYDDFTVFDNTDVSTLNSGDYIAVSGSADTDSIVQARYITMATPTEFAVLYDNVGLPGSSSGSSTNGPGPVDAAIEGFVRNLDIDAHTFVIGTLVVDYTYAQFVNIAQAELKDGVMVRVTGRKGATFVTGRIEATGIASSLSPGKDVIVDALVTGVDLPSGFELKGDPVLIDADTQVSNGQLTDIRLNRRLKLVGKVNDQNQIIAKEIEFPPPALFRIVADVTALNLIMRQFTLLGIDITVNSMTTYLDHGLSVIRKFSLRDFGVGDRIAVIGYRTGTGFVARRIDRLPGIVSNSVVLRGPAVVSATDGFITLLDKTIDLSQLQDNQDYIDASGTPITRQELISQLGSDELLEIEGSFNGITVDATRISVQPP